MSPSREHANGVSNLFRKTDGLFPLGARFPFPPPAGVCLVSDSFCVIIVEGGVKAVRRYEKLMMRRIDWTAPLDDGAEEEEDPAAAANKCTCVWRGATTTPTFRGKFRFETVRSEAAARKYLADMNLAHFYDAAAAAIAVDGPVEDE